MKKVVETLFDIIGDDSYHEMVDVSTEAFNSRVQFEQFINDKRDITREIIDDIVVYKYKKEIRKKQVEHFYGFTTFSGEDLKCVSIITKQDKEPDVVTDFQKGITIKNSNGNTIIYVHRTEKGCRMIDLRDFKLKGKSIKSIMCMPDTKDEGYIIACKEFGDNHYYSCTFTENTVHIMSDINEIVNSVEKEEYENLYPVTFDLFKYTRKSDNKTVLFSVYYEKIMNEYSKEYMFIRAFVGNPLTYDTEGLVVLYKPEFEDMGENSSEEGLIKDGDVYIGPLKGHRTILGQDSDHIVKMDPSLTRVFKPIHGINGFYSIITEGKDDNGENKVRFVFFIPKDGELKSIEVYGTSAPSEIFVCKETCTVTLVYQLQGYYQVVNYWESDMMLYRNSYVEIFPDPEVDIDTELSKYKDHLDSLSTDEGISDDEYFNLFYFYNINRGLSTDGREALISSQYSNMSTREVDRNIKRLYMSNNGKVLVFKRFDNTLVEYLIKRRDNLDQRIDIYDELDRDVRNEITRLGLSRNGMLDSGEEE